MTHHRLPDRRIFIGGSDARIIMGTDEAALVRLWREKRGEAEPPDVGIAGEDDLDAKRASAPNYSEVLPMRGCSGGGGEIFLLKTSGAG
jgi:hypothetical protein